MLMTGAVVPFVTDKGEETFADTLVTVPFPEPFPLNVFQSAEDKYPFDDALAAFMLITGVVVPFATTTGEVPVTLVTVPPEDGDVLFIVKLGYVPVTEIPEPELITTVWSGAVLVMVKVPLLVIGLPEMEIPVPAEAATDVTVPTLMDPPRLTELPFMVIVLLANCTLAMVPLKSVVGIFETPVNGVIPLPTK